MPRSRRKPPPRGREAAKAFRRQQLIASTIDCIAKRGFAETTLARVAEGAGLSRGIVNLHFQSKKQLLVETLRYLAEEYRAVWISAVEKAGPGPADKLAAMVEADFDRSVCNRKKIAVWYAFWGESKSRPTYLAVCGQSDEEYSRVMADLCAAIIDEGGYQDVDPNQIADGLNAMLNGFWLDLLLDPASFDRDGLKRTAFAYLASYFPDHFKEVRRSAA